jgi:RNA polymerase sigma-70 factor (ECF subfamily)
MDVAMAKTSQPWAAVASEAMHGNPAALNALLELSHRSVRAFVYSRLRDHARADDVTQEVLLRATRGIANLAAPAEWMPWLFGIARNCLREHQRDEQKQQRAVAALAQVKSMAIPSLKVQDESGRVLDALDQLNDEARCILSLKYLEGMSCKEIAHHLQQPLGSITSTLSRAYVELRRRLKGTIS